MRVRILSQRFISSINATPSTDIRHESTVQKASWSAVSGRKSRPHDDSSRFSTGFSTGVENLGGGQKSMELVRAGQVREGRRNYQNSRPLTTLGARRLTLTVGFKFQGEV